MNIKTLLTSLRNALKREIYTIATLTRAASQLIACATIGHAIKFRNVYRVECFDADGRLKWIEDIPNQVMTAGINDLLTQYFKGSAYTAAFYVGLVDNASFSAYAAADTMASHAGWLESAAYSNATRPSLTLGTPSAGSVDNSASKAVFNINATATILGAFVVTNSTKSGTTGTLYGAASFSGSRSVLSGDTLNVTITLSAS
jgi:hypothetical protein